MNRIWPRHPFWQAVWLVLVAYVAFDWVIPALTVVGIPSAPMPNSVVLEFMFIAIIGILMYVSENEARWTEFKAPINAAMVDADKKWVRTSAMVVLPLLIGYLTYEQTRPRVAAPLQLRSIHPAPPSSITFRGKTIELTGLENPLRHEGDMAEHLKEGKRVYYQNCLPCHGDRMDGEGHFGHGFSPTPLPFDDAGGIPMLTESFIFWRVAKGGPGLPKEGTPWNSAMPVWEDYLTENEIWAVILYLYDQNGFKPRAWEAAGEEGGHD